jgi:hypothetical protein
VSDLQKKLLSITSTALTHKDKLEADEEWAKVRKQLDAARKKAQPVKDEIAAMQLQKSKALDAGRQAAELYRQAIKKSQQ